MPQEIELKLQSTPAGLERLKHGLMQSRDLVEQSEHQLANVYFDTDKRALAQAGIALRLRCINDTWLQTLKARGTSTGGLHARSEWEMAAEPNVLNLALFADTPLADVNRAVPLAEHLTAAFRTDFHRTRFVVHDDESTIEIALDDGTITAGRRSEHICEVELELKAGEPAALFRVARRLLAITSLLPMAQSKAERGHALANAAPIQSVKASKVALSATDTVPVAAQKIIVACLEHLDANIHGVLVSNDPEFVHQARVALRRMRSATRLFRKQVEAELLPESLDSLRTLAQALGRARDADVFATESFPQLQDHKTAKTKHTHLLAKLNAQRSAARRSARACLRQTQTVRALLDVAEWGTRVPRHDTGGGLPLWALKQIARLHKRFLDAVESFATLSAEERHAARIHAKRARYAAEFLADVLPRDAQRAYAKALAGVQETLGRSNDAQVAMYWLQILDAPPNLMQHAEHVLAASAAEAAALAESAIDEAKQAGRAWINE